MNLKNFFITLLLFCSLTTLVAQKLSPIRDAGLYGFIDSTGKTIIPTEFKSVGHFSEGLAPARKQGYYGYINTNGNWAIKPQYEYAESFNNDRAIVYINGLPLIIDHAGRKYAQRVYQEIEPFKDRFTLAKGKGEKWGVIDHEGKLRLDTLYDEIYILKLGYYLTRNYVKDSMGRINHANERSGLLDSTGTEFIHLKENETCYGRDEKHIVVIRSSKEKSSAIEKVLLIYNYEGELVLEKNLGIHGSVEGIFKEGFLRLRLYGGDEGGDFNYDLVYQGLMDIKGNMVIDNPKYQQLSDVHNNRLFASVKDGHNQKIYLLKPNGQVLNDSAYSYFKNFNSSYAFVMVDKKWGVIDTMGQFIHPARFRHLRHVGKEHFAYTDEGSSWKVGIGQYREKLLTPVIISDLNYGFNNGVLLGAIDQKLSYINQNGDVVWQENKGNLETLSPLNIDYMNEGYFHAYSAKRKNELGGNAIFKNYPKDISEGSDFIKGKLTVTAYLDSQTVFQEKFEGIKVVVANTTNEGVDFAAQDSRLEMIMQAKNADGEWQDIEYLSNSWCGNSYHTLILNPNEYWEFAAPKYSGAVQTRLRVKLSLNDSVDSRKNRWSPKKTIIYSNEFDGRVNPGQFWRKPEYTQWGIMDPYFE